MIKNLKVIKSNSSDYNIGLDLNVLGQYKDPDCTEVQKLVAETVLNYNYSEDTTLFDILSSVETAIDEKLGKDYNFTDNGEEYKSIRNRAHIVGDIMDSPLKIMYRNFIRSVDDSLSEDKLTRIINHGDMNYFHDFSRGTIYKEYGRREADEYDKLDYLAKEYIEYEEMRNSYEK